MNGMRLGDYVLRHYGQLMTPHESAVHRHLTTLFKHSGIPPAPGTAADTGDIEGLYRRPLSDDPAVIADAQAGWEAARERIAARILRDHAAEIHLNRCPACGALTATPTARLCVACPHTWFHVARDVR